MAANSATNQMAKAVRNGVVAPNTCHRDSCQLSDKCLAPCSVLSSGLQTAVILVTTAWHCEPIRRYPTQRGSCDGPVGPASSPPGQNAPRVRLVSTCGTLPFSGPCARETRPFEVFPTTQILVELSQVLIPRPASPLDSINFLRPGAAVATAALRLSFKRVSSNLVPGMALSVRVPFALWKEMTGL